ncbi:MAG: cell wall-binding repeat-containing protein [Finegoldia magna]|nr:cell wall-binding repeat-containing protein [Finegoldia magna]
MKRVVAFLLAFALVFGYAPVAKAADEKVDGNVNNEATLPESDVKTKEFSVKVLCQVCNLQPVANQLEFELENLETKEVMEFTSAQGIAKFSIENIKVGQKYKITLKKNKDYQMDPFNVEVMDNKGDLVLAKEDNYILEDILVSKIDLSKECVDDVCEFSDKKVTMAPIPMMVEENGNKRALKSDEEVIFNLYNTSKAERVGEVKTVNGQIPALSVYEKDDYILFTSPKNKKFILADKPFEKPVSEFYFRQNGEGKLPIRHKAKNPYLQPAKTEIDSLTVRHLKENEKITDRVTLDYVCIAPIKNDKQDFKDLKVVFTSEYDTVTAVPILQDQYGTLLSPFSLHEGVQYSVKIDDPKGQYAIENFPFTIVDKSERGPHHPLGWGDGKYGFNHSYCGNANFITVVKKGEENKHNTVIKCINGNTSVSGMNFRDLLLRTIHPDKSQIKEMQGKDFDLFRFKLINPKRCEVSKMADGDFTIHRNIPKDKSVKAVYQVEKDGSLTKLDFTVKDNVANIKTKTLSIYDTVIEYVKKAEEKLEQEFELDVLCGSCNRLPVDKELEFELENLNTKKVSSIKANSAKVKFTLRDGEKYQIRLKKNDEYKLDPLTVTAKKVNGKIVALTNDNKVVEEILLSKLDYSKESVDDVCNLSDKKVKMAPIPILVKENGKTRPLGDMEFLYFTLYNLTRSEKVGTFMAYEGELASLYVYENDDYMLTTGSNNKQFILSDTPFNKEVNEFYFKANGEGNLPIRHKTKNPYAKPVDPKIDHLTIRPLKKDEVIKDKYTIDYVRILQDKNNPKDYSNVKLIFTSEYDTVTATTLEEDEWGVPITPIDLYEGVQYSVRVEDSKDEFAIANFPFTLVDKSERGPNHPLKWGDGKYVFNQTSCTNATYLTLVPKGTENDKNTELKSDDKSTTIKGMNFGDLMLKTTYPEKSDVRQLSGKDFDLFRFKLINPHRCEVTKMALGDFTIQRVVPNDKKVVAVYEIDKYGNLNLLPFKQDKDLVDIKTKTLSINDIAIEYTKKPVEDNTNPSDKKEVKSFEDLYKQFENSRISGENRYQTAIEISKKHFTSSENIVLTSANELVDSLTSTPLATSLKSPILLSGKSEVNANTLNEIKRLNAKNIYIVGGESTIPKTVESNLKQQGYNVVRVSGKDRYRTSVEVGKKVLEKSGNKNKIVLASGSNMVDALCGNSISAKENIPVLLTQIDELNEYTKKAIKQWNVNEIVIVGGKLSISGKVEQDLKSMGIKITRLSGKDRFETSVEVAKCLYPNAEKILIANGYNYVDALVSGPITQINNTPIILFEKDKIPSSVQKYLNDSRIKEIQIIGGTESISK